MRPFSSRDHISIAGYAPDPKVGTVAIVFNSGGDAFGFRIRFYDSRSAANAEVARSRAASSRESDTW